MFRIGLSDMTTVTLASSKPPITLTSGRGITITIDRSVTTSSGGGSGTVTDVTGTAPVVITGTSTLTPNVTVTLVSTVADGVMSSADKVKLDALSADVAPAFIAPSGVKAYGIPGLRPTGQGTATQSQGRLYYEPWFLETTATLDRLAVEVTTGSSAGALLRMGIYNADTSWVPTTLVVDAGTVAVDSTGIQAATINVTLPAGRYVCAFVLPTGITAPALRQIAGTVNSFPGISGTAGNPYQVSRYLASQGGLVATGLPSTATAPDVFGAAGATATANFHVRARWA